MSAGYKAVQWNAHKRVYDLVVLACVAGFVLTFVVASKLAHPAGATLGDEVLVIRALGACAFVLLHVILCIGPMARLDTRFAPLLYNRRHLGVTMCLLATAHGLLSMGYYGGFGVESPASAMLVSAKTWWPIWEWPFELFGFAALLVIFVMGATSHDFWLANLSARWWKRLHQCVYAAYVLLVAHVSLGAVRSEQGLTLPLMLGAGATIIAVLHVVAGLRERARESRALAAEGEWVDVASVEEIPDGRAKVVCLRERERVAIFRHEGGLSAVSNVCAHQGGPLGEGKIVGGCITCPWHGYQYLPHNGQSPPPFTEKLPTYEVRVRGGRVLLNPTPNAPGTAVTPTRLEGEPGGTP